MREYSNKIALIKNSRGIYGLDTSIGCQSGMSQSTGGCYNDCYAAKSAKLYGYDFSKTVLRDFESERHKREIVSEINKIKLDFVRIGCSGDPSENWEHAIKIIKIIQRANKEIVVITKHWTTLSDRHLEFLNTVNICINTSVSALDSPAQLKKVVEQYKRIKPFCKSVLRIVSCDFNSENETGKKLSDIQHHLFKHEDTIDTIFRPSKNNKLVTDGIINIKTGVFNGHKATVSKFNKKTYAGKCANCQEMCGVNLNPVDYQYPNKRFLVKQLKLSFK